jgi:uncharacterized repeat protein (TIGR01451 family)
VAGFLVLFCGNNAWSQYTYTVLHSFTGLDGATPQSSLIFDAQGNLYGTTVYGGEYSVGLPECCGAVYELIPPGTSGGAWSESVLTSFKPGNVDGNIPAGGLALDTQGNLYGVTGAGGPLDGGIAYEVSPPGIGGTTWTRTMIYNFDVDGEAIYPNGRFILDAHGNLIGTSRLEDTVGGDGDVYELSPPAVGGDSWAYNKFFGFTEGDVAGGQYPAGSLVSDSLGNLYGVTEGGGQLCLGDYVCGVVFEVSPPSGGGSLWTETVLYTFTGGADGGLPMAGVILDSEGNLYGTASAGGNTTACASINPIGCGVVFKLAPPAGGVGPWTETVLYTFSGANDGAFPKAGLTLDDHGNLYGTTLYGGNAAVCPPFAFGYGGCGVVFELSPPGNGGGPWTETVLHAFRGGTDGAFPLSGVARDALGNIYGTASAGGDATANAGLVFELSPSAPVLAIVKSHAGNFTQGQTGAQYTITVSNRGTAPTSAPVALGDALPADLIATAMSGTDWNCDPVALICTNSDTVAAGASFPPITLTVDVSCVAASSVVNAATAAGGGAANTPTATDPTAINSSPACGSGNAFTISVTPPSQTVKGGDGTSYLVTLKSVHGFAGAVALLCSGLPADASCAFAAPIVVLTANGTATTTMIVDTTPADASLQSPRDYGRPGGRKFPGLGLGGSMLFLGLCFSVVSVPWRRRRKHGRRRTALLAPALLWLLLGLAGCGGPPPGERVYTITVTGTAGTFGSASTSAVLVVD